MTDILPSSTIFEGWWQAICAPVFAKEQPDKAERFKMLTYVAWKTATETEREMCARICDLVAEDSLDLGIRPVARSLARVIREREE